MVSKNSIRMTLRLVLTAVLTTLALGASQPAQAYFSVINNGEMLNPGSFQASIEPQLILSEFEGFNAVGRFDQGYTESTSFRALLGVGKIDFEAGGFVKYVPFPDTASQPAIGAEAGVLFARVDGKTEFSIRLHPLLSKRFETEVGDFIPFAALPFGFTNRDGDLTWPFQIAGGAELRPLNMPNMSYFAELGVNINNAFSYLSIAFAYRFDEASVRRSNPQ